MSKRYYHKRKDLIARFEATLSSLKRVHRMETTNPEYYRGALISLEQIISELKREKK